MLPRQPLRFLLADFRAEQLREQEGAGKTNARLNSSEARNRADELQARLQKRFEEIRRERQLAPLPLVVLGGLLVAPIGLIRAIHGLAGCGKTPDRTNTYRCRRHFVDARNKSGHDGFL
jgi:hypothetical protein